MLRRQDAACAHLLMYRPYLGPGSVLSYVQDYSTLGVDSGDDGVDGHNAQVAKLLSCLGTTGAGRRAVIDAVAKMQGIDDSDELERLNDGTSATKLRVPQQLGETMMDIGLGNLLAPVNLITCTETAEILVNSDAWKDLEFEVALDSGSVVHVCSVDDIGGYRVAESPGIRRP